MASFYITTCAIITIIHTVFKNEQTAGEKGCDTGLALHWEATNMWIQGSL